MSDRALIVYDNGNAEVVHLDVTDNRAIAKHIGCEWIERVKTPIENVVLVVDEEGLYTDKPVNERVSRFYPGTLKGHVLVVAEKWVGDGIDFTGLSDVQLGLVAARLLPGVLG